MGGIFCAAINRDINMNEILSIITITLLISPGIVFAILVFSKRSILYIICVGFCLSIIFVGAFSIILEKMQMDLSLKTIAISFASFDVVVILIIIYRNKILGAGIDKKEHGTLIEKTSTRSFYWIFIIISLGFLFVIPFIGSSAKDYFTEIYLVNGLDGNAPWEIKHDKLSSISVDVNVTSHEKEPTSYLIELVSDDQVLSSIPILFLESGKSTNIPLTIPTSNKTNQLYIINLTKCPTLDHCADANQELTFWISRQ
jgi:uncharacterized membrane protein